MNPLNVESKAEEEAVKKDEENALHGFLKEFVAEFNETDTQQKTNERQDGSKRDPENRATRRQQYKLRRASLRREKEKANKKLKQPSNALNRIDLVKLSHINRTATENTKLKEQILRKPKNKMPTQSRIVTNPSDQTETMPPDRKGRSKASSPELKQPKELNIKSNTEPRQSKDLSKVNIQNLEERTTSEESAQDKHKDLRGHGNKCSGENTTDIQVDTINGVFMESDNYYQSGSDTDSANSQSLSSESGGSSKKSSDADYSSDNDHSSNDINSLDSPMQMKNDDHSRSNHPSNKSYYDMLTSKSDNCIGPKYPHINESSKRTIKPSSNGSLSSLSNDGYLSNSSEQDGRSSENKFPGDAKSTRSSNESLSSVTGSSDDDSSLQSTSQNGHSNTSESLDKGSISKLSLSSLSERNSHENKSPDDDPISSSSNVSNNDHSSLKNHDESDNSLPPDYFFPSRNKGRNTRNGVSSDASSLGTKCDHIESWTEARTENGTLCGQSYYPGKSWKYDYDQHADKNTSKKIQKQSTNGWEKQPYSGYSTWGVGKSWYGQPTSGRAHDKNMQQYADQESYQDDQSSYDPQNEYPDQHYLQYADQEPYQNDHNTYDPQNEYPDQQCLQYANQEFHPNNHNDYDHQNGIEDRDSDYDHQNEIEDDQGDYDSDYDHQHEIEDDQGDYDPQVVPRNDIEIDY